MKVDKLTTVDAFVVFDIDEATTSVGITRAAPKILVDGATWLARSQTYKFASFEQQVGGASAGVNAKPDDRAAALAAYVEEIRPWVEQGRFLTDAGKGVSADALAALDEVDPRPAGERAEAPALEAAGLVTAAEVALGDLSGSRVAIEHFDAAGPHLVTELAARGARVIAIATSEGAALNAGGFDIAAVVAGWESKGPAFVRELGVEVVPSTAALAADVEVLFAGSKAGVVDHGVATTLTAKAVVPCGPIPVTAKGLAVARRNGTVVLPDFVTTAGPLFAADGQAAASAAIRGVLEEVLDAEDGPVLAACRRAEAFLATWCSLPFGRPLA